FERSLAVVLFDLGDDIRGIVDDTLNLLRGHVERERETRRDALKEPDVADRGRKRDVADALAANGRARHFDATLVADHALIADAAVLTAVAFVILGRTKDTLAEQSVLFRTLGAVVDR